MPHEAVVYDADCKRALPSRSTQINLVQLWVIKSGVAQFSVADLGVGDVGFAVDDRGVGAIAHGALSAIALSPQAVRQLRAT